MNTVPCMIVSCSRLVAKHYYTNTIFVLYLSTVFKYFSKLLVLYLSAFLLSPPVLILVLEKFPKYSRTSIIRTPVCHFNVKGVQINEFVQISELSDKIHYLAS